MGMHPSEYSHCRTSKEIEKLRHEVTSKTCDMAIGTILTLAITFGIGFMFGFYIQVVV